MTVIVKFFANVKKLIGKDEMTLNLAPSRHYRIRDILQEIAEYQNKDISPLFTKEQGIHLRTVRVVLNGRIIYSLDSLEATVQDGDRIAIFPLLAGG
ncbi:MAG: MoaD family protein [Thermodesulfovibrionales bacterium]|nr:MoaD family protein [Thermodesulfovibrionales bacterium]